MKKALLIILTVMAFATGFSQPDKKHVERKNINVPENVYYLSMCGAISDAEIGMNSVTFGTDNTSVIQSV
ncbi:MAG: hypothetical protein EOM73_13360, partial [Bacteroidia bacterium]|nr:hypothetical protein [Bacteroidia bacterium]